jgi:hypothetical protein
LPGTEIARRFGIKPPPGSLNPVDQVDYKQRVALDHQDPHRFALGLARKPDDVRETLQNRVGPNPVTLGECEPENVTIFGRTPYGWHGRFHLLAGGMPKAEMQPLL